ncbi:MAG: hypothetical protein GKS07_01970 [Nitrosopumilus sp.]|nr:MAG: hypothetical protein GKS07_01970 [Nitrosopumilus sp.]
MSDVVIKQNDPITKNNQKITDVSNVIPNITKQVKIFYDKALAINTVEQRPFSCSDYPNLSGENYRQYIQKLRPVLEKTHNSRPAFYKIKGVYLSGDSHKITVSPTGDAADLIAILKSLKSQPAKIHDIKIKINACIHEGLIQKGCTPHEQNNSILVKNLPVTDNNMTLKALVYPKIIQIDVGCSYKPIVYDVKSLLYLCEILAQASMSLMHLSGCTLPPVNEWMITHYHLNKDGNYAINGQTFHFTVGDVSTGLIRYYSKSMPDGTLIPRVEQITTPSTSLFEEMKNVI